MHRVSSGKQFEPTPPPPPRGWGVVERTSDRNLRANDDPGHRPSLICFLKWSMPVILSGVPQLHSPPVTLFEGPSPPGVWYAAPTRRLFSSIPFLALWGVLTPPSSSGEWGPASQALASLNTPTPSLFMGGSKRALPPPPARTWGGGPVSNA